MATTYVEMTQGTPTSQRKFTYSGWIKKCEVAASANQQIFSAGATSDSYYNGFRFLTGDAFHINMDSTESATWSLTTTRLFRDTTAWYHIVVAIDTTQSVAADRMKLYINGVQETSFSETYYPTLNWDFGFMESVWWVFKQIYDKNLVYRGFKIMPYSTKCNTVSFKS